MGYQTIHQLFSAGEIVEDDISEYILNNIYTHFESYIKSRTKFIYGVTDAISVKSLWTEITPNIKKAIVCFVNKELYKERSIEPYLNKTILFASLNIYNALNKSATTGKKVCPACKYNGHSVFLNELPNDMYECSRCQQNVEQLKLLQIDKLTLESKIKLFSTFARHSKSGIECPDCNQFIPDSSRDQNGNYSCPYPNCFGYVKSINTIVKSHPVKRIKVDSFKVSLDAGVSSVISDKEESQEFKLATKEVFKEKQRFLGESLLAYKKFLDKSTNSCTTRQMKLMCDAYLVSLFKYGPEMVQFLFSNKGSGDNSLQSKIFQEYVELIKNALPFEIQRRNKVIDIYNLCDPNLALFEQISEYDAVVADRIIGNNTKEIYIGSRGGKNHGNYYIGSILDITCEGESILDYIDEYTFHKIKLNTSKFDGKEVHVKHYSILPHYEIGSLVYVRKVKSEIYNRALKYYQGG